MVTDKGGSDEIFDLIVIGCVSFCCWIILAENLPKEEFVDVLYWLHSLKHVCCFDRRHFR